MMGDIFPVVFLLVALLTVITTMTRLTNAQRMQIGLLKALGFKRGEILRHYVAYGFWLTAAGVLLGCVTGPLTLPRLFYPSMSSFYTLPEWGAAFAPSFVWVGGSIVALCVLMTYLACRGILSDTPARTLRPKVPKGFRHMSFERSVLLRRLGFNARWNLRDAVRNKARSLTAIIGVLGCTALIVCAFGSNDVMNDLKNWQYEDINRFESKLNLEDTATDEDIDELIRAVAGEKISENPVEIRANGIKKNGTFTVTDNVTLIKRTDRVLQPISLPRDGLSITAKMADMLGVRVGDEVEWHVYGDERWHRNTIAAVYREPAAQGISMSRAYYEAEGNVFRATSVLSAERVTKSFEGVAAILSTDDIISGWDDLTEAMYTLIYLLIIAAVVLAIVVLYNLGLLSFTEMERDMATLKVMGLRTKKLRELLLTQNIWFSVVGFALGIPSGLWLVGAIIATTGDGYDFPLRLHTSNAALSFAITFGLSIGVSLLFSKKIRKLNMVEALKSTE
jgi:putative ABC transport system permease protein